jgi:hypothetical protein
MYAVDSETLLECEALTGLVDPRSERPVGNPPWEASEDGEPESGKPD